MKKASMAIAVCLLIALLSSAASASGETEIVKPKAGEVTEWGSAEEVQGEKSGRYSEKISYDSFAAALMALYGGRVDLLLTDEYSAQYTVSRNPNCAHVKSSHYNLYAIGLSEDKAELLEPITDAINDMRTDGTLDALIDEYITAVFESDAEPEAITPPETTGDTLRVVVTGDFPPMDYVSVEGAPTGFNVALLYEIARRTNVQIELIAGESGARMSLLASGRADAVFYVRNTVNEDMLDATFITPEGIVATTPYLCVPTAHLYMIDSSLNGGCPCGRH